MHPKPVPWQLIMKAHSDSKHDAILQGFESYMKGNGEMFNSYLGINYLAHIEQTLIKIVYIKRS